jgi:hypothetical protein
MGWADRASARQPEGGSRVNGYRRPRRKEIRRKSHHDLRKIGYNWHYYQLNDPT